MKKVKIQEIFSASLSSVQPAKASDRALFPEKKEGQFYVFTLASGQAFVGHIPEKNEQYTFRTSYFQTYSGPFPRLAEIRWTRVKSISDLNYSTECVFLKKTLPTEQKACLAALTPKRDYSWKGLTKIAFKYYRYHPMLERAICLQGAYQDYRKAQQQVRTCQKRIKSLLISKHKTSINQQQTKGEKQNVRN